MLAITVEQAQALAEFQTRNPHARLVMVGAAVGGQRSFGREFAAKSQGLPDRAALGECYDKTQIRAIERPLTDVPLPDPAGDDTILAGGYRRCPSSTAPNRRSYSRRIGRALRGPRSSTRSPSRVWS